MSFSQRIGATSEKSIQINSMDEALRNRLYNALNSTFPKITRSYYSEYDNVREFVLDKLGFNTESSNNNSIFNKEFLYGKWHNVYNILEIVMEYLLRHIEKEEDYSSFIFKQTKFVDLIQKILEDEKSGYRLLNNHFVPITCKEELESLEESSTSKFNSVGTHMRKAVALYSDRKKPDYENSIKESICAVESICCIITKSKGSQATLGNTLKKLEKNGIIIHTALKEAFNKMYGYTSDNDGTRHGSIDFNNAPAEDAKYMLISCSAFVNYLTEKLGKAEVSISDF